MVHERFDVPHETLKGTVALSVDIITAQEIFWLAVAPSAHAAVLSD